MRSFCFAILLLAAGCTHAARGRRYVPPADAATLAAYEAAVAEIRRTIPVDVYEAQEFRSRAEVTLPYRVLRPLEVEPGRTYPLVVIFHGAGAIGSDNAAQIGPLARSWATPARRERHRAFVVVPQFADRSAVYTGAGTPAAASTGTPLLEAALELLDELTRTLPVDRQRISAIGFSMGGSALWNAIARWPGLFASAAIVGGVPPATVPPLGRTRLLLVHGDADTENPFAATMRAYEETGAEFWQYRDLGHEFPLDLIVTDALAEWLFVGHR